MYSLIRRFEQWICKHPNCSQVRRSSNGRLFTECLDCGLTSKGVQIAAFLLLALMFPVTVFSQATDAPKPQPFFDNTANRVLVGGEITARLLDAVSTEQFMHDSCHCMSEQGHFLWMSMKPIAERPWVMYGYSVAFAGGVTLTSRALWKASQKNHSKMLRVACRLVLITDTVLDGSTAVKNWRLIGRVGGA